ncbi:peptide deformylase [Streptomyces sp. B6B3]|uniref:peptide deformylase n=1 Tax=Streptomyces sp. B6B3 TaxID=3153570 RepID=UPI00325C4F84
MTVRTTLQLGDPELRDPVPPIDEAELADAHPTAEDLADTLADWVRRTGYGRGIAAPQIGARQRLVYLAFDRPTVLVNPEIVARSEETWEPWDTCLSFSVSVFCRVRRSVWVEVEYQSLDGRRRWLRADGELGELLQHEIDHVDGVLAVDRMTSVDTLCMRSEFERRHRDESPYRP